MPKNCLKKPHPSAAAACAALHAIRQRNEGTGRKLPVRAYRCEFCQNTWHLTSRELSRRAA